MRRSRFLTLPLAFLLGPALFAGEATPTVDTILDKFIEATGGRDAYSRVKSEVAVATMEFLGKNIKGKLQMWQAAPAKSYVLMDIEGVGKTEQGTWEDIAWENSAIQGPRIKSGPEKAAAMREADIHSHVDWKKHYRKAELAGVETVDGTECYKVIMTPVEGSPETRFYDKKFSLLVRTDRTVTSPMGEIPTQTKLLDYRNVGGLLTPHRLEQTMLNQKFVTVIESIQYNTEIPAERFVPPAEVQALARK